MELKHVADPTAPKRWQLRLAFVWMFLAILLLLSWIGYFIYITRPYSFWFVAAIIFIGLTAWAARIIEDSNV